MQGAGRQQRGGLAASWFAAQGAGLQTVSLVHKKRKYCFQGSRDYVAMALGRLRSSKVAHVYKGAQVGQQGCAGYSAGPRADSCFPEISVAWSDAGQQRRPASEQGLPVPRDGSLKQLCDDGSMMSTASVLAADGSLCVQGPRAYASFALERLQKTPLAGMFNTSQVSDQACADQGHPELVQRSESGSHLVGGCFGLLTVHTARAAQGARAAEAAEAVHLERYAADRQWLVETAHDDMRMRCDAEGVMANLPIMPHRLTCGPGTAAGPCFSVIPDNGMACVQGSREYLAWMLERYRSGPLAGLYAVASPLEGPCESHGYSEGPEGDNCFPRVNLFMDIHTNADHTGLMLTAEGAEFEKYADKHGLAPSAAERLKKEKCDHDHAWKPGQLVPS